MGNITGSPFRTWVTEQIKARQKALGQYSNIDPKNLLYYTTKTPWIRLASSVNVNNGKVLRDLIKMGFPESDISGDNLAKKCILQGGVVDQNANLKYGLSQGNIFNGAYGWGGKRITDDGNRGFAPLPGILNARFTYYSHGTYGKAEVQIQCFSRQQMALIDTLYLRPGYTLLLEFGWSVYIDNTGNLKKFDNFTSDPLSYVLNPIGTDRSHFDVYKKIKEEKKKHYGNYEAVYGKIHHFKWSFQGDGSYICTVSITGMGDIIESLKVNTVFPPKLIPLLNTNPNFGNVITDIDGNIKTDVANKVNQARIAENKVIVANANKSELVNTLNNIYETYENNGGIVRQNYTISIPDPDSFKPIDVTINNAIFAVPQAKKDGSNAGIYSYYITFGTLLSIIYSKLLLYDKKNGNQVPLFKFDMNFKDLDKDENYILRVPGGFSGDPSKCLVGLDESFLYPDITIPQSNWSGILSRGAKWIVDDNPKIGRLANIYVSIGHILDVLNNIPKEKDGSITLLSFLKEIINTIQSSLGNINSIVIKEDPHEGIIRFIENAPQPIFNTPEIDENGDPLSLVIFNLYGVKPGGEGSFVRNLSLEAEISNNLTTMIVAGAQINSNQLTVNATAFSQYNDGLKDRVLTERTNWNYTPPSSSVDYSNEKITELWNEKINPSNAGLFQAIYGDQLSWSSENLLSLKELNNQFLQLSVGNLTEKKQISTPFFMPFKLGFDMDGMSGIRLWEKFLIDDTILPPAYGKDNIDLQVTAINHTINNASWITHIDAIPAPAIKTPGAIKRPSTQRSTVTQQQPANQTGLSTPVELGTKADFWSLVAISAAENFIDNPQGMADVAQSIYNRLAAKTYGKSIKSIIVSRGQYEPTFKNLNDWRAIKDEQTAIKAYQNSKRVSLLTATQAINTSKDALKSSKLQLEAKIFVGSRTEFYGGYENFVIPPNPKKGKQIYEELKKQGIVAGAIERNLRDNLFFWRYSGKNIFYNKNVLIAQNPPSNIFQLV